MNVGTVTDSSRAGLMTDKFLAPWCTIDDETGSRVQKILHCSGCLHYISFQFSSYSVCLVYLSLYFM